MKRILLLFVGICITLMLNAQVLKTVNVTAGGLFSALTPTELSTVTNLTVTGTVDARDFKTMRDNMPVLANIDISGATIVSYNGTEGTAGTTVIDYPANVLPQYAFYSGNTEGGVGKTALKAITFPSSITSVGIYAFRSCTGLLGITIPASVTTIGDYAFSGCSNIASFGILSPSFLTSIGVRAFEQCRNIVTMELPSFLQSIGNNAFSGCSGITTLTFGTPSVLTSIGNSAFSSCSKMTSVEIPSSVTTLGQQAFQSCSALSSVTFASSSLIASLGSSTFSGCTMLASINIPASVSSIGSSCFSGCSGLTTATFSASSLLTSIGNSAFYNCTKLTAIEIPDKVTSIGNEAFRNCIALNAVNFVSLSTLTSLGTSAFKECDILSSIVIPLSLTTLPESAFEDCINLTSVSFSSPSKLNTIGRNAFRYCAKLKSINIPETVTSIGSSVFSGCSALTNVTLPALITSIESSLFRNCTSLTSVNIPNGVTIIQNSVFMGCSALTSIIIPYSVTTIGGGVFYDCTGLTSITTERPIPVNIVDADVFYGVNKTNCVLKVPYQGKALYTVANYWKDFLNITEMPGFRLSGTNFNIESAEGSNASVDITANVSWNVSSAESWLAASPVSDSGNKTVALSAQKNSLAGPREAIVSVNADGIPTQTIKITQAGAPKEVNNTAGNLKLNLSAEELNTLTRLAITGTIDARDFKTMRDNMPLLESIDISQATIIAYSGTEGTYGNGIDFSYAENAIPTEAFYIKATNVSKTSLKTILMPPSVRAIMPYAFYGCSGIGSVAIPSSVLIIWDNAFRGCSGLTAVTFAEPASLTTIDDFAFGYCGSLNSVALPNSLLSIGIESFYNNIGLKTVYLPASLNTIGRSAFSMCSALQTITTEKPVPVDLTTSDFVFYNVNKTTCLLKVPYQTKTLYAAANQWSEFLSTSELHGFKLSASIVTLTASEGSTANITISSDVNWSASSNQAWLTVNPETGNTLNTVQFTAQANTSVATRLAEVTIASPGVASQKIVISQIGVAKTVNVTAGGLYAALTASERKSLTRLVVTGTIDARDFKIMRDSIPLLAELDISGATISAYSGNQGTYYTGLNYNYPANTIPYSSFHNFDSGISKTSLNSVLLPSSVTSIGDQAFRACTGLESLNFSSPSSLNNIGSSAFYFCTSLKTITIPSSVTSVESYAFWGCSSLTSVNFSLPSSLTTIGQNAFENCTGLTSFTIPSLVTTISVYTFAGCTGLTTVTIPSSVTTIQAVAFGGCSGLTSIIAENPLPVDLSSSVSVFGGVNKTTCKLYAPYESKVLYAAADQWKDFLTITEMPFRLSANEVTIASLEGSTGTIGIASNIEWSASSDQAWLTVSPASGTGNGVFTFTAQANPQNISRFATITVSAEGFESQSIIIVTQQANDNNNVPVANAGPDQTVEIGVAVTLDGSVSTDTDGNQLTFKWTAPDGITLNSTTAVKPEFTAPVVVINTTYKFSLIVNDGTIDSPADTVVVTVRKPNTAPVANAGPDKPVNEGASVSLDGSGSSDPDSNTITYLWSAPAGISLSSATVSNPTFTAPEVNADTQYTFSLVVNDGKVNSSADQITVTVKQVNKVPVANAGADRPVDEGAVVTLDGSASTDGDGSTLTYKWTAPAGITLNSTTVVQPGFTAPEVATNTNYTFSLVVNDGTDDSPADQIIITVRQLNVAPVANASADKTTADAGEIVTLDGSASTDVDGNQLTYNWTAPAGITLNSTTDVKPSFTAPAAPANTAYTFTLVVNDGFINSNSASVTINVKALPVLSAEARILNATGLGIDSSKVDQGSSQITLYLSSGAVPQSVSPVFQISPKATINPANGSIQDFSSPVNYVVTSEDGKVTKTYSVKAKTFPDILVKDIQAGTANINPGDSLTINWKVENISGVAAIGGWAERISLIPVSGSKLTINPGFEYRPDLAAGATISRSKKIKIPELPKFSGDANIEVEIITFPALQEYPANKSNNTALSANRVSIGNLLSLYIQTTSVLENTTSPIRCIITRSGDYSADLPVSFSVSLAGQVTLPATVTIPANQSSFVFNLNTINNLNIDGQRSVTITANAIDYTNSEKTIAILDDEIPGLSAQLSKSSANEGEVITLTVTRDLVSNTSLSVNLSTIKLSQWTFPSTLNIPVGAASGSVTIGITDDNTPELTGDAVIFVSSAGFTTTQVTVSIEDNDVPQISLEIITDTISESAGVYATWGVVRRITGVENVTVNLTANVPDALIFPSSVSIPKGIDEQRFNIGAIDNALVDSYRRVDITGAIFLSSCNCSTSAGNGGTVSASLVVADNDGPSLSVSVNPVSLPEGKANAGMLVISRNTPTTADLVFNISHNDTSEVSIQTTATILAGQHSVNVPILTKNDNIEDGSQMVSVQATATGFTSGYGYFFVTDQNKPDLEITDIVLDNNTALTGGSVEVSGSVMNIGFATAPSGFRINFYLSSNQSLDSKDILLGDFTFGSQIPAKAAATYFQTLKLPSETGNLFVIAKINPDEAYAELIYFNNTSESIPLTINPAYNATAIVDNAIYLQNTTISINGSAIDANQLKVPNADVDIYILSNGIRRELKAKTDNLGNYTVSFVPLPNESGHFVVGSSFPKHNLSVQQDAFDIPGIKRVDESNIIWEVMLGKPVSGKIAVKNTSEAALTNLTVASGNLPAGCNLQFSTIPVLNGNQTAEFTFTLEGTILSSGIDYEKLDFLIQSAEGVTANFPVWYYCESELGMLKATPEKIVTTITKGKSRMYELAIKNNGLGATGKVSVSLPPVNWMRMVTPDTISNIAPGDIVKVILLFEPDADMPLNTPISGNIALNCAIGTGTLIPYSIELVSEETGGLSVDVIDEYTYYTEAKPHVKNAHIVVRHPFSGAIVAEGFTAETGLFYVEKLPEGQYIMTIEAEKHESYRNLITIDPGRINEQTIFLSFQAITYTWEVVPTQIEDQYEIKLVMNYETNVPKPVVIIEMIDTLPRLINDETFPFLVTLTNKGLITAEDVEIVLPMDDPEYEFVFNIGKFNLLAQQSIQVPVLMRLRPGLKSANTTSENSGNCVETTKVYYFFKCGKDGFFGQSDKPIKFKGRSCEPEDFFNIQPVHNVDIRLPGYPTRYIEMNGIRPDDPIPPHIPIPISIPTIGCNECLLDIVSAAIGCFELFPAYAIPINIFGCVKDFMDLDFEAWEIAMCIAGFFEVRQALGCIIGILDAAKTCILDPFLEDLNKSGLINTLSTNNVSPIVIQALRDLNQVKNGINASDAYMSEILGNMEWQTKGSVIDFMMQINPFITVSKPILPADLLEIQKNLAGADITAEEINAFSLRWNSTLEAHSKNIHVPNAEYPNIFNSDILTDHAQKIDSLNNYIETRGFDDIADMYSQSIATIKEQGEAERNSVCSSISISITQKLVMTREAFEGTLTIFNGNTTTAMEEIKLNLEIRDENGILSNDLFQINTKALSILTGIDGTGTLGANEKGSATVIFIPEKGAAPTVPKNYSFGGSFSYLDPFTGVVVTRPLYPVTLTVNPSPDLYLHYFMQRNILGDDPLTEAIEPIVPAEFALMIQNNGFGTANNVRIAAVQPKIAENEKGLAINFELIGSNLNGQPRQLGLIDIDFGNIAPQKATIGQWWFTSSLLGHFVSYDATVTHLDSRGNPDISLISGATMHELIRSVRLYSEVEDGINDFLVNEVQDSKEFPDVIYLSNGGTLDVHEAISQSTAGSIASGNHEIELIVTPEQVGWNYIKFSDPGDSLYRIASVTREDGQVIPLDNVWQTNVTLPDSKDPVYENMMHFLDGFAVNTPQKYTIRFVPIDQNPPEIDRFENIPVAVVTTPVASVNVIFKKPIDPATFNYEDMVLRIQGGEDVMDNSVTVSRIDSVTYKIDLTSKSIENGFYALTVQTNHISSPTGTNGLVGKQASWTQIINLPAVKEFTGLPENNIGAPFDLMLLRFNLPIDYSTLLPERFTWSKDGLPVSGAITVTPMDTDGLLFQVSGFQALISQDGKYSLTVDLPNIKTESGVGGILTQSVSWEIDKTAPQITQIIPSTDGGFDSQHFGTFTVKFSEPVKGIVVNSLELWKDGQRQPISQLTLSMKTDSEYLCTQFRLLTYYEGSYQLKVKMEGITDNAGNSGTDTVIYDWTVYRTAPLAITNLRISPDMGFSDTDGITSTKNLVVNMTVNQDNSRIQIYQTDQVNPILLADTANVNSGPLSLPLTFSYSGNVTLEAHCIDVSNNKTVTKIPVFIDEAALAGTWKNVPLASVTVQPSSLQIEFSDKLLDDSKLKDYLKFERDGQLLGTQNLSIVKSTDKIYSVSGIDLAGNIKGNYSLSLDVSKLQKYTSGKQGTSVSKVQWSNVNVNKAPVANAGSNQSVDEGATVTLDGSTSSDPDGNTITYLWTAPAGITLSSATVAKPTFTAPEVNTDTQYTFTLVTKDGSLNSLSAQVVITVKQVNKAPVANASSNQTVNEGVTVTLDGSGSSDPDGNTITWLWTAPSGITLTSATADKPTFTAPEVNTDTQYTFTLVTNDGSLNSLSAQVVITVKQVNKAPVANAGSNQTVDEGVAVTLDGSGSSDPDGNTITWLWTAPSGITLSSATAEKPTFTAPEVNTDTQYTFTLVTKDGSLNSLSAQVVITVKQVNKAPVANAGSNQSVDEGATVTLDGSASSDPDGNSITWLWTAPAGITLSSTTVAQPTFTAPQVNTNTQYSFTLVTKDGSLNSLSAQVVITVTQVNKAPVANAGSNQSVDEGATVTLDGSASSDPDGNSITFLWTAPAGITLSSATVEKPTFTAPEVNTDTPYTFTLVANDGSLNSLSSQVVITVKQENKAPVANAGFEQTIEEETMVTLDGSDSSDPDGNTITWLWTAPSGITLSSATADKPTFTAPQVRADSTIYFSLIVSDGKLYSTPIEVKILVKNVIKTPSENLQAEKLNIYPNPSNGIFRIEGLTDYQQNRIEIYSTDGKLIRQINSISKFEMIDISDQVSGIFLLLIDRKTYKIIKY